MIESSIRSDLDGDGQADGVLELIETLPLKSNEGMPPSLHAPLWF